MIEFKNKSRAEAILENMLGATNDLKPPQSRVEALLIELLELIEDISHGSGTVFRFLGEKEYVDDLPETGNEQGDVWFIKEKMAGFIWIVREDYPDGYWEELGEVIDTKSIVNSINGQTGVVVLGAEDVNAQTPFLTTTLTIAVSDWNNGSCTKTVTGMTADALGFIKYSDTEGEYTETQGKNIITFTVATTPSEAVTVDVAWFKGQSPITQ